MPPLDSPFGGSREFYRKATWKLSFAWMPHRCIQSNQFVWLKNGYLGTAVWTGPGTPVYEYNWHTKEEHLIWCIKNG